MYLEAPLSVCCLCRGEGGTKRKYLHLRVGLQFQLLFWWIQCMQPLLLSWLWWGRTSSSSRLSEVHREPSVQEIMPLGWCSARGSALMTVHTFFLKQRLSLHKQCCACPVALWEPHSSRWLYSVVGNCLNAVMLICCSFFFCSLDLCLWTFLLSGFFSWFWFSPFFFFLLMILSFCSQSILRLKLFNVPWQEFQTTSQKVTVFLTPLVQIQSRISHFPLQSCWPQHTWSEGLLPGGQVSRVFQSKGLSCSLQSVTQISQRILE